MNKMYAAPKAEVVELNMNKDFMQGGGGTGMVQTVSYENEDGDL